MKNKLLIFLIIITVLSLFLRLFKLGSVPPSLNWDEASLGYNAYSLLTTARDEYGNFLPPFLKSFGDWKPALYAYFTIPSVAIFGLTEFAVRFPSAIFGALSVLLIFFIVRDLFYEFSGKYLLGILSSLILCFSPWNFHYSRGAWEVNLMLFMFLAGIYFFLRGLKSDEAPRHNSRGIFSQLLRERNPSEAENSSHSSVSLRSRFFAKGDKSINMSAFIFGLSFYAYQSAKFLVPIIILGLVILFKNKLGSINFKRVKTPIIIFLLMVLPVFYFNFVADAGGRLKVMSVFSYPRESGEISELLTEENGNTLSDELFHNNLNFFGRGILGKYLNHFSPRFLFFEGDWDNPRNSSPFSGVLNFADFGLLVVGVYFIINRRIKNQSLIWFILFIAPIPSALTRDTIQATRSYLMVIPLTIISAFGAYYIFEKLSLLPKILRILSATTLFIIYLFGFAYFLDQFFVHAPVQNSSYWQYGYKEVTNYFKGRESDYEKIIISQKYGQPYIYYLFYSKYPPSKYQKQSKLIENTNGDVGRVEIIDNIEFRDVYWPGDRFQKNYLVIGDRDEIPTKDVFPNESKIIKDINFLNGETAFRITETLK